MNHRFTPATTAETHGAGYRTEPLGTGYAAEPRISGYLTDPPSAATPSIGTPAIAPGAIGEDDGDGERLDLLGNQPAWQRDALAASARVRALLAALKPVVVQVLTFWDHVARSVRIGGRIVEVDPSGSYRLR